MREINITVDFDASVTINHKPNKGLIFLGHDGENDATIFNISHSLDGYAYVLNWDGAAYDDTEEQTALEYAYYVPSTYMTRGNHQMQIEFHKDEEVIKTPVMYFRVD